MTVGEPSVSIQEPTPTPLQSISSPPPPPPVQAADSGLLPNWLTLSGSVRTRYERLWNQFRPGLDENDQALPIRTLLRADADFGALGFTAELQDSRAYLTDVDGGVSTIVVNAAELLQGFVGTTLGSEDGEHADLKLGWQTMDLGGRRLVARNRFRNTIQNYAGLSADWQRPDSRLFLFWTLPVTIEPSDKESLVDNEVEFDEVDFDYQFWGAHYTHDLAGKDVIGELYLFGLWEQDDPSEQQTADRRLLTPGVRLLSRAAPGKLDYEVEAIYQFGSRRASRSASDNENLDVSAFFTHAAVGYTFDAAWNPALRMEFDYGTGEDDPSNGEWTRFDSLFGPRRTEYGPTDIYGLLRRENNISFGPRLALKPSDRLDGYVSWRLNYLESRTDQYSQGALQDPTGASGRFAGHQVEVRARYWIVPKEVLLESGAAYFVNGTFMEEAPNANGFGDPFYFYVDFSYLF